LRYYHFDSTRDTTESARKHVQSGAWDVTNSCHGGVRVVTDACVTRRRDVRPRSSH